MVEETIQTIKETEQQAEEIIKKAEKQRAALIDENAILQEARRRATEEISNAQQRSNIIRNYTQDFTDKMLARVEELMLKDVNDIRIARKTLSSGGDLQQKQPQQQGQQPQQQADPQKK